MINRIIAGARFGLSAAVVWGADLLTFALLYPLIGIPAGVFVSRAIGGVVGFAVHKRFSFRNREKVSAGQVAKFVLLWSVNYALSLAGVSALVATSSIDPAISKAGVDIAIFAANYFLMSRIFRPIVSGQPNSRMKRSS